MTYLIRKGPRRMHRRHPIQDMIDMQQQMMGRLFEETLSNPDFAQPLPVDVWETDNEFVVEAALPGMAAEEVDISIQDNTVTITAERKTDDDTNENVIEDGETVVENAKPIYHIREVRRHTELSRAITLPGKINSDAANANFVNGILTLTVPKAEELKPKRIAVNLA